MSVLQDPCSPGVTCAFLLAYSQNGGTWGDDNLPIGDATHDTATSLLETPGIVASFRSGEEYGSVVVEIYGADGVIESYVGEFPDNAIYCPPACQASYRLGTPVTLAVDVEASLQNGAAFDHWGGDCAAGGAASHFSFWVLNPFPFVCQAYFVSDSAGSLTVEKFGEGDGIVASSPEGIYCGSGCAIATAPFPLGETVTVVASQSFPPDGEFVGWGGDCSNDLGDTSLVQINGPMYCSATFDPDGGGYSLVDDRARR